MDKSWNYNLDYEIDDDDDDDGTVQLIRFLNGSSGTTNKTESLNGTLAVLIIVLVLICIIWAPSLSMRCRRILGCDSDTETSRHNNAADEAALQVQRMQESIRQMMEDFATMSITRAMSPEDRKEFISNCLLTKRVVIAKDDQQDNGNISDVKDDTIVISVPEKVGSAPETTTKNDYDGVVANTVLNSSNDDDDENNVEQCAICLRDYEDGDIVSWSHNQNCHHIFHRSCILEWLVKNDECPICRRNYLSLEADETEITHDDEDSSDIANLFNNDNEFDNDEYEIVRGMRMIYDMRNSFNLPDIPTTTNLQTEDIITNDEYNDDIERGIIIQEQEQQISNNNNDDDDDEEQSTNTTLFEDAYNNDQEVEMTTRTRTIIERHDSTVSA